MISLFITLNVSECTQTREKEKNKRLRFTNVSITSCLRLRLFKYVYNCCFTFRLRLNNVGYAIHTHKEWRVSLYVFEIAKLKPYINFKPFFLNRLSYSYFHTCTLLTDILIAYHEFFIFSQINREIV